MSTEDRDRGYSKILEQLRRVNRIVVTAGIQDDGTQDDGMTMAQIGAINEFGTSWVVSKKQAHYMARRLMGIDPDAEPERYWGSVRSLTGKTITIPERSFLRSAVDENEAKLHQAAERAIGWVASGELTLEEAFNRFGFFLETVIKQQIDHITSPPNAPLTKQLKNGGDKPLIHSGRMQNSIRYVTDIS